MIKKHRVTIERNNNDKTIFDSLMAELNQVNDMKYWCVDDYIPSVLEFELKSKDESYYIIRRYISNYIVHNQHKCLTKEQLTFCHFLQTAAETLNEDDPEKDSRYYKVIDGCRIYDEDESYKTYIRLKDKIHKLKEEIYIKFKEIVWE